MPDMQKAAKRKLSNMSNIANQDVQANGNSRRSTNPGNSANMGRITAGRSRIAQRPPGSNELKSGANVKRAKRNYR
jgi:hypothetical protein